MSIPIPVLDPAHVAMDLFDQPITQDIWKAKYRYEDEAHPEVSHMRVCLGVYAGSDEADMTNAYHFMKAGIWVPAGRIHAGAGTKKQVTWINCYVSGTIEDSMVSIGDRLKEAMLTMQQGGGIGMDFSTLRPNGAYLQRTGSIASGPLPFMDMWDSMCRTIMSAGFRRGAMMGVMSCDHPDVFEFVEAKHKKGRLTNFNLSVLITDMFMAAVEQDLDWRLGFASPPADMEPLEVHQRNKKDWYVYTIVKARELWETIIRSTYDYSEPGVIFIDRINDTNNLQYLETITTTNPCGEQPLPPYGACCLGHINLARLVKRPFSDDPAIDTDLLRSAVRMGVRFLDHVLDNTPYPLVEQRLESERKRRIGLGYTGLANLLAQMKVPYNSTEAIHLADIIGKIIANTAYQTSAHLANEKGAFPGFNKELINRNFITRLDPETQKLIGVSGLRNGVILTIAPTGTTSIYYGNVSSGLEPVFSHRYQRKVIQPDGSHQEYTVEDYGYRLYKQVHVGIPPEPSAFMQTIEDLTTDDHLAMQAAVQKWVDSSVSKTINCSPSISFEDFKDVYKKAYESGVKGCTTYRPTALRGSVLSVTTEVPGDRSTNSVDPRDPVDPRDTAADSIAWNAGVTEPPEKVGTPDLQHLAKDETELIDNGLEKRPEVLTGTTYKVKWPSMSSALYVTINNAPNSKRPYEIFIASRSSKHTEWITALTLSLSAIMRREGDISFILDELKLITSPHDTAWIGGKYYGSLVSRIGDIIEKHIKEYLIVEYSPTLTEQPQVNPEEEWKTLIGEVCTKCEAPAVIHKDGCSECLQCGDSTCS